MYEMLNIIFQTEIMKTYYNIIKKVIKTYAAQYTYSVILNKVDIVKLREEEKEDKWKG